MGFIPSNNKCREPLTPKTVCGEINHKKDING